MKLVVALDLVVLGALPRRGVGARGLRSRRRVLLLRRGLGLGLGPGLGVSERRHSLGVGRSRRVRAVGLLPEGIPERIAIGRRRIGPGRRSAPLLRRNLMIESGGGGGAAQGGEDRAQGGEEEGGVLRNVNVNVNVTLCTIGISRPLMLKTTISPTLVARSARYRNNMSPR